MNQLVDFLKSFGVGLVVAVLFLAAGTVVVMAISLVGTWIGAHTPWNAFLAGFVMIVIFFTLLGLIVQIGDEVRSRWP